MSEEIKVTPSQFADQGKVGEFLIEVFGLPLREENERAAAAGLPKVEVNDELMAADDFYFSTVELMDCCIVARCGERLIGTACVNPFTSTLHFIAVAPEFRRQGIGRRLLAGGAAILKKRGCDHVKIEYPRCTQTEGAELFFAACGYREIAQRAFFGSPLK